MALIIQLDLWTVHLLGDSPVLSTIYWLWTHFLILMQLFACFCKYLHLFPHFLHIFIHFLPTLFFAIFSGTRLHPCYISNFLYHRVGNVLVGQARSALVWQTLMMPKPSKNSVPPSPLTICISGFQFFPLKTVSLSDLVAKGRDPRFRWYSVAPLQSPPQRGGCPLARERGLHWIEEHQFQAKSPSSINLFNKSPSLAAPLVPHPSPR